jgi:parallel beta-helix repeat protein
MGKSDRVSDRFTHRVGLDTGRASVGPRVRMALITVGLAVTSLSVGVLHPSVPASAASARWTDIPCSPGSEPLTVMSDTRLDAGCTYHAPITITASHVTLDCRGAVVNGIGQSGVGIEVSTPDDQNLSDVTIRNCDVTGFTNGMRVTRAGFHTLPAGGQYVNSLSGVDIKNSTVTDATGVGIYIDGYVTHVTLSGDTISGNGSTGAYLEEGSMDNVVKNDKFLDNGFVEDSPTGELTTFAGQQVMYWGTGREGLAIDGSRHNLVSHNDFQGNAAGGVFLYRNCGEFVDQQPANWFPRPYGADGNDIKDNTFTGGDNGVWVASRMGENVFPMDCSETPYVSQGIQDVDLDEASGNTVKGNTFDDVVYGVRVEDNDTTVKGNTFVGGDDSHYAVVVGTPYRTSVLNQPVTGTVVSRNQSAIPNPSPYRWVDGQTSSTYKNDDVSGTPVGWCQSKDLPRTALIFVIALAADPGGGPLPPPANLAYPTVGAQAACTS